MFVFCFKGKETNSGSGPVFDVIVWNDGKQYNAVLNTISMDSYVNCTDLLGDDTKEETKSDEDSETVLVEKDGNGDNVMNISGLPVLTNYKIGLKYATISSETMLNYVLNIYDDGM